METAAANVIQDAMRSYARKRARTFSNTLRKRSSSKRWLSKPSTSLFRVARTVSTGQAGITLLTGTTNTGIHCFRCGSTEDQTLQMDFAFDAMRIYLGGTQVMAIAVPAYTELGSLFDKFRIEAVEVYYSSSFSESSSYGSAQSNLLPNIVYCVDTDDAGSNTATEIQQYANCRNTQLGGVKYPGSMQRLVKFRPCPQMTMYTSTSPTAAATAPANLWLDCGTPTIRHYGLKMAIDQITPSSQIGQTYSQINFQVRYHFAFKDIR